MIKDWWWKVKVDWYMCGWVSEWFMKVSAVVKSVKEFIEGKGLKWSEESEGIDWRGKGVLGLNWLKGRNWGDWSEEIEVKRLKRKDWSECDWSKCDWMQLCVFRTYNIECVFVIDNTLELIAWPIDDFRFFVLFVGSNVSLV